MQIIDYLKYFFLFFYEIFLVVKYIFQVLADWLRSIFYVIGLVFHQLSEVINNILTAPKKDVPELNYFSNFFNVLVENQYLAIFIGVVFSGLIIFSIKKTLEILIQ